ncbi:type I toxin-antitoxin system Fst family toxin [Lapidilactobacillus gannanensis]|uniref:Type I toxin-antitoxin system Fst family toxin n=1 Tax=Lapidilactobacillus gannanensis TaxID=2486002 RepID=A0ABW4BQZ8_9LACO|nr:type I toxin-antitoxin system Fst family toxin [Lapidilactobacillus gannanensis]MCH4057148.1 type I toxin-antitoxin system Fst family toxin [Lactobacillaceae bacterium]
MFDSVLAPIIVGVVLALFNYWLNNSHRK